MNLIKRIKIYRKPRTLVIGEYQSRYIKSLGIPELNTHFTSLTENFVLRQSCFTSVTISTKEFLNSQILNKEHSYSDRSYYKTEDKQDIILCNSKLKEVFGYIPKRFYYKFC
jgi:hypothetical protein